MNRALRPVLACLFLAFLCPAVMAAAAPVAVDGTISLIERDLRAGTEL
jgi:hypothetical protein